MVLIQQIKLQNKNFKVLSPFLIFFSILNKGPTNRHNHVCCVEHVSISSTFYARVFHTKANFFSYIRLCNFLAPKFRECETLMKLTADLSNVRPACHMWPAKHLNLARKHFLSSLSRY